LEQYGAKALKTPLKAVTNADVIHFVILEDDASVDEALREVELHL